MVAESFHSRACVVMQRLDELLESHSLFSGVSDPETVTSRDLRSRLAFHKDIGLLYSERNTINVLPLLTSDLAQDSYQVT